MESYTREEARIKATQHAWIKKHYGQNAIKTDNQRSIFDTPLEFEQWFLKGIRYYESKGLEFEFLAPGLIRIIQDGKPNLLRTVEDFKREHAEYKTSFYN